MGIVFRGNDDDGVPRYEYVPEENNEPERSPPPTPIIITTPVEDPVCPNPILFFCAGCAVGAVVVLVLKE